MWMNGLILSSYGSVKVENISDSSSLDTISRMNNRVSGYTSEFKDGPGTSQRPFGFFHASLNIPSWRWEVMALLPTVSPPLPSGMF